ncbi:hypothetical protein RSOLAG22IIIB_08601 [Rhizoctonia solani]|uniref:Uncharacterized protein n=1 Tax=Rhizoctonia solani TaxID=456999 RepID=A0A0K6FTS4_9AGAM|nr:hypothetical protein RSOLAG22IIIB_08601 [Rhizoctonia solani]
MNLLPLNPIYLQPRERNPPNQSSSLLLWRKQAVAKQNTKESQGVKKAEATVFEETPNEMAVFLAKAGGQLQPSKTSPNLTSLKRSRPLVVVTMTKQMLVVVVAKPNSTNPSHKNAANMFLHAQYALRFHSHLSNLTRLHHTHGSRLHKQFSKAEIVDEEDPEARESGGGWCADGGLSSPASSKSNGEADTDGEGASGTVATQVDGDQTMMTIMASDSKDN